MNQAHLDKQNQIIAGLLHVMESAIRIGDWIVDGRCDPATIMTTADSYLKEQDHLVDQDARLREWLNLTDAGLRLHCGELTAQEIRTVRAVLSAIAGTNPLMSEASASGIRRDS